MRSKAFPIRLIARDSEVTCVRMEMKPKMLGQIGDTSMWSGDLFNHSYFTGHFSLEGADATKN